MGLLLKAFESRDGATTLLSNPAAWLYEAFGAVPTDAGIAVSPSKALKYTAVYACVNVIAQSIAQVPWDVYRKDGKKKVVARDRTEHYLLHAEPNGMMSSYSFRVAFMVNVLLGGNFYIEIVRDGANRAKALHILPFHSVTVYEALDRDRLFYKVTRRDGTVDDLDGSDVIHVPCISLDGISGLSPVEQHRQSIGLGLAAEAAGSSFFGNGSRPSGFLSTPQRLSPAQRDELEERWFKKFGGPKNTGKVPIIGGDLKWNQTSIPPADAQYIETRIHQVSEIARIYRVPAVLVGLADKTSTYASADAFFLAFVKFTLTPWVQAIEQEFDRKLFPNTDQIYCKMDLNGLLRGDAKGRAEFYKTLWATASLSSNDIRDWEELDPVDGGDRYFVQQGFMPLDKVDEVLANQAKQAAKPQNADPNATDPAVRSCHIRWLDDVCGRVGKWEKRDRAKLAEAFYPVLQSLAANSGKRSHDAMPFCNEIAGEFSPADTEFASRSIERFHQEITA